MSYVDKIIEANSTPAEPNTAEPEVKAEEPKAATPAEEPKPEDPPKAEEPKQDPPAEEPPKAAEPKPDLSTLTKEQKAEHAFKRQLSKQRERHEAEIKGLVDSFQKQFDDLKNSLKQPEPKKTRADFPLDKGGDDAYIQYLVKQGMDEARAAEKAEKAKMDAEQAEKEGQQRELEEHYQVIRDTFNENIKKTFSDPAQHEAFIKNLKRANDNGFAQILDMAPAVRDYIFTQEDGPAVLNKMLLDRSTMEKVLNSRGNPIVATITMHSIAEEIKAEAAKPAEPEQQPQQKGMPHLGKPGARGDTSRNVLGSDKDVLKFIRSVH